MSNHLAKVIRLASSQFAQYFKPDPHAVLLVDCSNKESFMKWKVVTDQEIKGKSTAKISFNEEEKAGVFSGNIDMTLDPTVAETRRYSKSGYAAARSPHASRAVRLYDYDAMEVKVKGDGRVYVLNLIEEIGTLWRMPQLQLYQTPIITDPGVWQTSLIPFSEFLALTFVNAEPFPFPGNSLLALSFLQGQRLAGPFRLEIAYVKAVRTRFLRNRFSVMPEDSSSEDESAMFRQREGDASKPLFVVNRDVEEGENDEKDDEKDGKGGKGG